jgi:hypothetical protein
LKEVGDAPVNKALHHKLDTRGDITVRIVDGVYICGHMDEEFTNFGQHYRFKFIPKNEFWIDNGLDISYTKCIRYVGKIGSWLK